MMDGKSLSAAIRKKKKMEGQANLRADMDSAGQTGVDPNEAWDEQKNDEVSVALHMPDHEPASDREMGENESSQSTEQLRKSMMRIKKYLDELLA